MTEKSFFVKLKNRGLIHVEGADRHNFLQNLVTNDMEKLQPGRALYACLLTPQGKFLHDFLISEGKDFILLECEGGARAQDLYKRLNTYRLRADVQISVEEEVPVYAIITSSPRRRPGSTDSSGANIEVDSGLRRNDDNLYFPDPRHPAMGFRSFTKPDLPEKPFAVWDEHRIKLCIPDGSRDLIPEKSTLDEGRIDQLNGVSYEKGCYVGQELTARMHHRGLGKKHLQTVNLNEMPKDTELRSFCGTIGLALLRTD